VRSLYSATQLLVVRLQGLMAKPQASDVVMAEATPPSPPPAPTQVSQAPYSRIEIVWLT